MSNVANKAQVVTLMIDGKIFIYVEVGKNKHSTSTANAAIFLNIAKEYPVPGKYLIKRSEKKGKIQYFIGKGKKENERLVSLDEEEANIIVKRINGLMEAAKKI